MFTDYTSQHKRAVSTLYNRNPRWVVAAIHPHAGLCNRIMHIISCLAFSMATGRALLFDWDGVGVDKNVNKEDIGQSDFLSLFQQPPISYSYRDALNNIDMTHEQLMSQMGVSITDDNMDFVHALRNTDLDRKYNQQVIYIVRYDWWAPPLFENNMYSWEGMGSRHFFSYGFKFLFHPVQMDKKNDKCDWLVQVRFVKYTKPLLCPRY
jgi:hypothetical protein